MESEGNVGGSDPAAPAGGAPAAPTGLSSPSSTTPTQPTGGSAGTQSYNQIYAHSHHYSIHTNFPQGKESSYIILFTSTAFLTDQVKCIKNKLHFYKLIFIRYV